MREVIKIDYAKLTNDLIQAKNAAIDAAVGDDGGSANLDTMTISLPRAREKKVLDAIKDAGLYCQGKSEWIGPRYFIQPPAGGQGNSRVRAVDAMAKVMKVAGYDVLVYHRTD